MARELNLKVNLSYKDGYIQGDDDRQQELMFIFWGILIPIIGIIGCIGNTLTMIVLFRREMKSTTVYFLRALVVTDTAIIIGAFIGLSSISITQKNPNLYMYSDYVYPLIYTPINYIVMALQMTNVWLTVAVSVERYIAICHPFRAVKFCNKRNAFIVIGVTVIVSVIYNIPRCFATSYNKCTEHDKCFAIITTEFGKSKFFEAYSIWLYMLLIYIIPLLLLGVLNTLLIIELMAMSRRRTVTNNKQTSEANMTLVLVLIVVVFLFCQTPGLLAQFQFLGNDVIVPWTCVSNDLVVLNSSVNFLIYTAVGRKFRKVLLKTCHVLIKRPVNQLRFSYSQNGGTELAQLNSRKSGDIQNQDEELVDETCNLNGGKNIKRGMPGD